jgi:hypothetical protein
MSRPAGVSNSIHSYNNNSISTPEKSTTHKQQEQGFHKSVKQQISFSLETSKRQIKSSQKQSPHLNHLNGNSTMHKFATSNVVPVGTLDAREEQENGIEDQETTQEIEDLVTKLHTNEAKLNWMLEAEIEAQNTNDQSRRPIVEENGKNISAFISNTAQWKSKEAPEPSTR